MTRDQLIAELTATRRRQRLAFLAALAPFYIAFALGWMTRTPIALFLGALGLAAVALAYRRYAPKPPEPIRQQTPAAGDEE